MKPTRRSAVIGTSAAPKASTVPGHAWGQVERALLGDLRPGRRPPMALGTPTAASSLRRRGMRRLRAVAASSVCILAVGGAAIAIAAAWKGPSQAGAAHVISPAPADAAPEIIGDASPQVSADHPRTDSSRASTPARATDEADSQAKTTDGTAGLAGVTTQPAPADADPLAISPADLPGSDWDWVRQPGERHTGPAAPRLGAGRALEGLNDTEPGAASTHDHPAKIAPPAPAAPAARPAHSHSGGSAHPEHTAGPTGPAEAHSTRR